MTPALLVDIYLAVALASVAGTIALLWGALIPPPGRNRAAR